MLKMANSEYIKILSNITYDINKLVNFYTSVKNNLEVFYDTHLYFDDPFFRCVCVDCSSLEPEHEPNSHLHLPNLDEYQNEEILKLQDSIKYLTLSNLSLWVFKPNYVLRPHKDFSRTATITMPILPVTDKVGVDVYQSNLPIISNIPCHDDEYLIETYNYNLKHPTVLNSGSVIHGFRNNKYTRVMLYASCNLPWDQI
jgi:hypothetical protein